MRKVIAFIIIVTILVSFCIQPVAAHGIVYDIKQLGENKIRITLKWSDPKEAKGIVISYFYLKNGKTLNLGYELNNKAPSTASMDYDLSGAIPPIRIVISKVGDLKWVPFKDIKGIEAEEYVRHLHDAGIIDAGSDGKFRPKDNITRAEFATILVKALKLDGPAENTKGFTDIGKSPAKKYILLAVKNGLMSGNNDKTFKPDGSISVAQVCSVISKAFKFKTNRNGLYSKIKKGKPYTNSVVDIFDAGILTVNDSIYKNFNEEAGINRANCAMIVSRAISTY